MTINEESFEEMLNESVAANAGIGTGEKIRATVISIGKEYVFLDLGTRSEGMMFKEDIMRDGEPTVAVGDSLVVFTTGAKDGTVTCALRMGAGVSVDRNDNKEQILAQIKDAYDSGIPVEGAIKEVNKGGFSVEVFGILAFCPISQIARGFCETPDEHLNKKYDFAIIKFEEGGRNVVLSRRQLLEEEAKEEAAKAWSTLKIGDTFDGEVSSLQPYGAFVNIGGIDGLIHISEISHTRINHPDEVLKVGQKLKVQIRELDELKRKVSLSLKSLMEDPWLEALTSLTTGRVVMGKVVRIAQFGAFIELVDGVEGLVHISQMAENRRINNPREIVSDGDEVKVRILEIDSERRRISLAIVNQDAEEERDVTEKFRSTQRSSGSKMGTLGDLLKNKSK